MTNDQLVRFFNKVEVQPSGCWVWKARVSADGYATFRSDDSTRLAHRISYIHFNGEIPNGLELDHLCRVRECVNPKHLEAVTHAENVRRGMAGHYEHPTKDRCKRGHPLDGDNLMYTAGGKRRCKECVRLLSRKYRLADSDYKKKHREYARLRRLNPENRAKERAAETARRAKAKAADGGN